MRHREHTFKIGRTSAHRRSLLANQVCSLIHAGEIHTTVVKAKETKRLAEKMITLGKKGGLHNRRLAISTLHNVEAVKELFETVAPKFSERNGGYTRIIRTGQRIGDAAETCLLQWVEDSVQKRTGKRRKKQEKTAEATKTESQTAAEPAQAKGETPAEPVSETPPPSSTGKDVAAP